MNQGSQEAVPHVGQGFTLMQVEEQPEGLAVEQPLRQGRRSPRGQPWSSLVEAAAGAAAAAVAAAVGALEHAC